MGLPEGKKKKKNTNSLFPDSFVFSYSSEQGDPLAVPESEQALVSAFNKHMSLSQ